MNRRQPMDPWLLLALVICIVALALAAVGCGPRGRDTAAALDVARRLHYSACEEAALLPPDQCAAELTRLVALEPGIENALAKGRGWRALWAAAKPWARAVAERLLALLPGWAGALVPVPVVSRVYTRIQT